MHLRSISMKGFKSFPTRTKLDFAPGVSVIVGPNGSGKSNITDARALGARRAEPARGPRPDDEGRDLRRRARGQAARARPRSRCVIDNSDGALRTDVLRDLDRAPARPRRRGRVPAERRPLPAGGRARGALRHGARQGDALGRLAGPRRAIVLSRPRERRLLIEEAAGLGKHRKRRRRAQLKLERTQENLSRALDVEREARSRLRPLKRQAEAAELHERLERQSLEARMSSPRDAVRAARAALAEAEERARAAAGRARRGRAAAGRGRRPPRGGRAGVRRAEPRARAASRRSLFAAASRGRPHRAAPGARPRPGVRGRASARAARRSSSSCSRPSAAGEATDEAGRADRGARERAGRARRRARASACGRELAGLEAERGGGTGTRGRARRSPSTTAALRSTPPSERRRGTRPRGARPSARWSRPARAPPMQAPSWPR